MGGAIIATTTIALVALLVLQTSAILHKHGLAEHQHALAHHTDCSHSRPRAGDRTIGSTLVQASAVPHKHGVAEHPRAKDPGGYNPTMPPVGYNPTMPPIDYNPTRPPYDLGEYNPTRPPALIGYNPTRPPVSDNPIGGTFVALLGPYPGNSGSAPAGTIVVTEVAGGIEVRGTLTGLEASASGGIHIHSGFSCENGADVGGHYYDGLNSDPWTATTYTSDANGVASVRLPVSGFTLWENSPVAGRALVIQDSSGTRVGCGLLDFSTGQVVHMGKYPGYSGTEVVQGTIVTKEKSPGILITGTLGGLPASTTAGFHIHSGFSCDDDAGVGGHYFQGLPEDPWTTEFTSDARGAAQISLSMIDFSLFSSMPVMGRTVVMHNSIATKIGCGLIGEAETLAAYVGAYPGYSGTAPSGTVAVTATSDGMLQLRGILTGLEPSATGGIHVHSGFTCGDAGEVGDHYYSGSDPWTTTYTSDASGVASVSLDVPGFSLSGAMPVAGRALVVHNSLGTRVGCGLLDVTPGQVAHLGVYPGYTGSDVVQGTIVTTQTSTGIFMKGTVAGLPASTAAGYHIHAGYSCDAADGVYNHYFKGLDNDPWTTTYTSDANGAAQISQAMEDFSVYAARPVMGRTYVFHGGFSERIGCGVIGYAETLVASIGNYPGYSGSAPSGTLQLTETYTGVRLSGVLTGLEASATGGIHVHSGFTCSDSERVGDHYYDTSGVVHPSDPWTTTYTSDVNGVASITLEVAGLSISDVFPVAGRAVVVHASAGARTGCGLLRVTTGQVTPISLYPGSTGAEAVVGLIVTEDAAPGVHMNGTLAGLPASAAGGFHVHEGFTCGDHAGVGAHYYEGLPSDPWSTTYGSDSSGAARISQAMSDFSLHAGRPVLSRAIVVHGASGERIGCGVTPPDAELPATTTPPPPAAAPSRGLSRGAIAAIIAGASVGVAASVCLVASGSAASGSAR